MKISDEGWKAQDSVTKFMLQSDRDERITRLRSSLLFDSYRFSVTILTNAR